MKKSILMKYTILTSCLFLSMPLLADKQKPASVKAKHYYINVVVMSDKLLTSNQMKTILSTSDYNKPINITYSQDPKSFIPKNEAKSGKFSVVKHITTKYTKEKGAKQVSEFTEENTLHLNKQDNLTKLKKEFMKFSDTSKYPQLSFLNYRAQMLIDKSHSKIVAKPKASEQFQLPKQVNLTFLDSNKDIIFKATAYPTADMDKALVIFVDFKNGKGMKYSGQEANIPSIFGPSGFLTELLKKNNN